MSTGAALTLVAQTLATPARAQTPPMAGAQDAREQQRLEDARRQLAPPAADALSGQAAQPATPGPLVPLNEKPCFVISEIVLKAPPIGGVSSGGVSVGGASVGGAPSGNANGGAVSAKKPSTSNPPTSKPPASGVPAHPAPPGKLLANKPPASKPSAGPRPANRPPANHPPASATSASAAPASAGLAAAPSDGEIADRYGWTLDGVAPFRGQCLGEKGLNALVGVMQNALIGRGLVTTRAVVGQQNLRTGRLEVTIVEGRLRKVVAGPDTPADFPSRSALPMRPGDLMSQYALEQGLENFKRLPTVDANFRIVPGDQPGESDLAIDWKQAKPWRVVSEVNDGGVRPIGRYRGILTGYYENALGLNDLFYASINHNLDTGGGRNTIGGALHYSAVYDYWLASFDAGRSDYAQTVSGAFQDYKYSGVNSNLLFSVSRVVHRDGASRTALGVGLWAKNSSNYIDDTEIEVQRRRTAGFVVEAKHRQHVLGATIDATVSYSVGERWFSALPAPEDAFGEGASRPRILKGEVIAVKPFTVGPLRLSFETDWRFQWTDQPLVVIDRFAIGGRTTVRGFDGENILLGERGLVVRNTLASAIGKTGQEFYVGVDHGEVSGPSTRWLSGTSLTGAVAGFRGRWQYFNYDVFVGRPVAKPPGFVSPSVTAGFMIRTSY